jgi:hypothetical protein
MTLWRRGDGFLAIEGLAGEQLMNRFHFAFAKVFMLFA